LKGRVKGKRREEEMKKKKFRKVNRRQAMKYKQNHRKRKTRTNPLPLQLLKCIGKETEKILLKGLCSATCSATLK
jgi:hypothetical protein